MVATFSEPTFDTRLINFYNLRMLGKRLWRPDIRADANRIGNLYMKNIYLSGLVNEEKRGASFVFKRITQTDSILCVAPWCVSFRRKRVRWRLHWLLVHFQIIRHGVQATINNVCFVCLCVRLFSSRTRERVCMWWGWTGTVQSGPRYISLIKKSSQKPTAPVLTSNYCRQQQPREVPVCREHTTWQICPPQNPSTNSLCTPLYINGSYNAIVWLYSKLFYEIKNYVCFMFLVSYCYCDINVIIIL